MGFRELVRSVQKYSGFSNEESKDALEIMVESIAVRLDESKRKDFAAQLPEVLSDMALSVYPSEENSTGDIVSQFMKYEKVGEGLAKKRMLAAWRALKEVVSDKNISQIKSQLPTSTALLLS